MKIECHGFSQGNSVAFLDYRLVNSLVPMPVENKLRDGWTKWIFRRAMEPFLPSAITWRKDKQYFKVPRSSG
jgi:asparagine synthase (glutamine-hydrolysing)